MKSSRNGAPLTPDRYVAILARSRCSFRTWRPNSSSTPSRNWACAAPPSAGMSRAKILSLPKYDPFWAKAQELGVVVFMHPQGAENVIKKDALKGRGDLGNIIGNPLETTIFLTRMMFNGAFDRFPGLKICAAHAGGYLPSYLGRTEVACEVRPNADCANKKQPSEYMKSQVLVDTIVISEEGLRHLVAEVGSGQVVFGTDVPFNWHSNVDLVLNAPFLSDAEKEAILGGTLVKLLRI